MQSNKNKKFEDLEFIANWVIVGCILVSVIGFSIESLPDLRPKTRKILKIIEYTTIFIFIVEYIARIYFAKNKTKFIFSFYGIIDLLAILPSLILPFLDLRSLRLLRALRFLRLLKLTRYNEALKRLNNAFFSSKEEIIILLTVSIILIFLSGIGIYYFEHNAQPDKYKTVFDGLWWAVATLTTVGYGDVYPVTMAGKLFTIIIIFLGVGLVAGTAGIFSSALLKIKNDETR